MAACDPQALLNSANCFDCLSDLQLEQVQVQMLCDLVNGTGLAGGPFVRISGDTMTGSLGIGYNYTLLPALSLALSGSLGVGTSNPMHSIHSTSTILTTPTISISADVYNRVGPNPAFLAITSINDNDSFCCVGYGANASGPDFVGMKTRSTNSSDADTIVADGDLLLGLEAFGADGAVYRAGGSIQVRVDGIPGLADMPGRVEFRTTTDGSGGSSLKMTLKNDGKLGILTAVPKSQLDIVGNLTVGATYGGVNAAPTSGAIIEGRVGIGTNAPAAAALLDLVSTTLGFKLPTMTTAQKAAIANTAGLMVFDTTLGKACVNSGAGWETITSI